MNGTYWHHNKMKIQRFLILAFAAALTAGTCAANTVVMGLSAKDHGVVSISGNVVITFNTPGSTSNPNIAAATLNSVDGWQSISIDYQELTFSPTLTLYMNSNPTPLDDLASYNAAGTTIFGLTGVYYALNGAGQRTTTEPNIDYGSDPINYSGNNPPWSNYNFTSSSFEEVLTGYIYLGTGTPSLSDVPADQQSGSSTPEPASWWLMASALPLMLFSKLRLRRAKSRD
jgi:hypothetical protein